MQLTIKNNNHDAILEWRSTMGSSKLFANFINHKDIPLEKQCLRRRFAVSDTRNCVHGSDSPLEVERELSVFEPYMKSISDPREIFELPDGLKATDFDSSPDEEFLIDQLKKEIPCEIN